ncbi:MAG: AAA family ATPase [Proteobacteria bacterium]|nr:AAA family ATPase [Pseudomonadota bacterium]
METQSTDAAPGRALACALQRSLAAQTGEAVTLVETHISWVLLTAQMAYKLKKPVRLPFLDFRNIEARKGYCEEELRINRRTAPELYLDVLPVCGPADAPCIGGDGPAIDYVVRMRRFPPGALYGEMLVAGTLLPEHVDRLAQRLAALHRGAPAADAGMRCVEPQQAVAGVLSALEAALGASPESTRIASLRAWFEARTSVQHATWLARRAVGAVRECHGDLHLGNVVWLGGDAVPFDAIEFDPGLRWIDVISDTAFATMDLQAHGRSDLAYRLLDVYLQCSGDYEGLASLRYYEVYRAAVRALVNAQLQRGAGGSWPDYIGCALRLAQGPLGGARLLITCGVSGSGKSTVAARLVAAAGAIRLRSDVERKRLFGLQPLERTAPAGADLYASEATRRTYERLIACARKALQSGYPVIADAAFLRRAERRAFEALAGELRVPFAILHCHAERETLRQRVAKRNAAGRDASDADEAVLLRQLEHQEPIAGDERHLTFDVVTDSSVDIAALRDRWLAQGPVDGQESLQGARGG